MGARMRQEMRVLVGVAVLMGISATVSAQQGPRAVVKRVVDEPATAAPAGAWRAAAGGSLTDVRIQGPGTRIAATADRTLVAPLPPVSGAYTIRAMFQRVGVSSGPYGVALGCADAGCALTVLLRSDGAVAVQRPGAEAKPEWTAGAPMREMPETPDQLEVRVEATAATILVNGQSVLVAPIAVGEADGSPGLFVATGADVLVTALTIEQAAGPERAK